jgi:hypothetical protein
MTSNMTPERLAELRAMWMGRVAAGIHEKSGRDVIALIDAHERLLKAVGPFVELVVPADAPDDGWLLGWAMGEFTDDADRWDDSPLTDCVNGKHPTVGQLRELQAAAKGTPCPDDRRGDAK